MYGATLAWIAHLYKVEQMHGGFFCQGLCKWQRIGRIRAVHPASCGVGEPSQLWCPFVAGDLSPASWLLTSKVAGASCWPPEKQTGLKLKMVVSNWVKDQKWNSIKFEAGMCKELYSNQRDQMPEHGMKSADCRAHHRREVSSLLFLFQQVSGMMSLPCWAVALI